MTKRLKRSILARLLPERLLRVWAAMDNSMEYELARKRNEARKSGVIRRTALAIAKSAKWYWSRVVRPKPFTVEDKGEDQAFRF